MKRNGFETFEVDETLSIEKCKDEKNDGNVHIVDQKEETDAE